MRIELARVSIISKLKTLKFLLDKGVNINFFFHL